MKNKKHHHLLSLYFLTFVCHLKVMDPLLPLGVLSGCLSAYSGVEAVKVKRESANEVQSPVSRPLSPSQQPVKIKYLSNLIKDVNEGFTRIRSGSTQSNSLSSARWDEDFKPEHSHTSSLPNEKYVEMKEMPSASQQKTSEVGSFSSSPEDSYEPSMDFKVTLPHNFEPLRSKFCGDNFQMQASSVVKNAFMSPANAEDELLLNLPHVEIVVSWLISFLL